MSKELIENIKAEGSVANYVINHYWEMSKEDLRDVCQELSYVVTRSCSEEDEEAYNEQVIDSLEENHLDED